jgi:hypothetical protein
MRDMILNKITLRLENRITSYNKRQNTVSKKSPKYKI